ncbi:MAG: lysine decarboxylase, partial [Priestia megaterium]
ATGYHLQKELEKQDIYTELADVNYVLFVLPLSSSWDFNDTIKRVRQAVANIQRKSYEKPLIKPFRFSRATVLLSMEERKLRTKHMCSFEEAIGCVSAQSIIPYPPGIPILMEGETITSNHIDYILHIQRLNGHIQGGSCMEEGKIEVFK